MTPVETLQPAEASCLFVQACNWTCCTGRPAEAAAQLAHRSHGELARSNHLARTRRVAVNDTSPQFPAHADGTQYV